MTNRRGRLVTMALVLALSGGLSVAAAPNDGQWLSSGVPFELRLVRFEGNSAFSDAELASFAESYIGQVVHIEDLEAIRQRITEHYVKAGYITSGAAIDEQRIEDGAVTFRIIRGRLAEVKIDGLHRLRPSYLRARLLRAGRAPMQMANLQNSLRLLNQDANIYRLNAELKPTGVVGESYLHATVEEAQALALSASINNHRPPSIGAEHIELGVSHGNVFGFGDRLSLNYDITDDAIERFNAKPENVSVSYSIPLHASNTSLSLFYRRNDSAVIEEPFDDLAIESDTRTVGLSLRQPVRQTPRGEVAVFISGEHRISKSYLLGQPFAFTPTAEDGEIKLSVLRLGTDWSRRSLEQVLSTRLELKLGTTAFNASDGAQPNGQFAAAVGQISAVRRLGDNCLLLGKLTGQWSAELLPSLERFSIGGRHTVRGFRENQLVRDRGVAASLEVQRTIWQHEKTQTSVTIAAFIDSGYAENTDGSDAPPHHLASAGLGIIAQFHNRARLELYWGDGFRNFDSQDHDSQDDGLHIAMTLTAF